MSSWGPVNQGKAVPFHDVLSEQLADELQTKEAKISQHDIRVDETYDEQAALKHAIEESLNDLSASGLDVDDMDSELIEQDTESDAILAQMLQDEWNKEQNALLDTHERKISGNSKVKLSLAKYKCDEVAQDILSDDSDDDYDSYDDDTLDTVLTPGNTGNFKVKASPRYRGGKDEPTKHDSEVCGRKNAAKVLDLPPEYQSGDNRQLADIKLSNVAFNKLKTYCQSESKRLNRLHEKKEHSTTDMAVDARTRLLLYKMINNGILETAHGILAVGKESVVIQANGGHHEEFDIPAHCAVKIYKTTLSEFKNRQLYVYGDHRFSKDAYKKQNPRRIIKLWASKEKGNLLRMTRCGIPCPRVVVLNKHILVMSLIGSNGKAAPQIRLVDLTPAEAQLAYDQTIEIMKKLYTECELVHADLSQYNLLWCDEQVYVIDVSQSVALTHPRSMEFLYRDCEKITQFFASSGVFGVATPEQLFMSITGLTVEGTGPEFLAHLKRYQIEHQRFVDLPQKGSNSSQFEYLYEISQKTGSESSKETCPVDAVA